MARAGKPKLKRFSFGPIRPDDYIAKEGEMVLYTDFQNIKRRYLKNKQYQQSLINSVERFVQLMGVEMKKPSSYERGQRIAAIVGALEAMKDTAKRYGLR